MPEKNVAEVLGDAIRRYRVMAGFSNRWDLATVAGCSTEVLRCIEKGDTSGYSQGDLNKILPHLGLEGGVVDEMNSLISCVLSSPVPKQVPYASVIDLAKSARLQRSSYTDRS